MIKIITILILIYPSICFTDEWTNVDTSVQVLYSGLHITDWNQTLQILESDKFKESNQILGEYPSKDQVNLYFATTLAGHYFIAKTLSQPYRAYWQMFWLNIQYNAVKHNHSIGLKINF